MTIPRERFRSLENTRHFLRSLLDPKATPRVPKEVRRRAYWCLRHFPETWDMKEVARVLPDLFNCPVSIDED
jgi:hypothetical protein